MAVALHSDSKCQNGVRVKNLQRAVYHPQHRSIEKQKTRHVNCEMAWREDSAFLDYRETSVSASHGPQSFCKCRSTSLILLNIMIDQ